MDGRIEQSLVASYEMKNHRNHQVIKLILQEYHLKFQHQFQEAIVRTKFWIPQLRVAVENAKNRYQVCQNNNTIPIPSQMSKLPGATQEN